MLLTRQDVIDTKRGSDGFKRFPPHTEFSRDLVFPSGCAFGAHTTFGENTRFLRSNTFSPDTVFGDFCRVGPNCSLSLRTYFGQRAWVGTASQFDNMLVKPGIVIASLTWAENPATVFNLTTGLHIHSEAFTGLLSDFPEQDSETVKAAQTLANLTFRGEAQKHTYNPTRP